MSKSKKIIIIISIILVVIILTSSIFMINGKSSAIEPVTLYVDSMMGGDTPADEHYKEIVANFAQINDIPVVDRSEESSEAWKTKISTSILNDEDPPDVVFYFTEIDARELILNDKFVSVEEIREIYPSYGTNIRESTMGFMTEFNNKHYALPVRGFWEGLFCNKDLFDRYNLPLPTDWNSFLNAITVFNENGITPISASLKEVPHYLIEHLILSEGGYLEHRLNPYTYTPDSWINAMDNFVNLYNLNAFPYNTFEISNSDAVSNFANKQCAMMLEGSWTQSSITAPDTTVVIPFPSSKTPDTATTDVISGFSSGFYITRKVWNDEAKRDLAVSYVTHMTSNDSIAHMSLSGGAPAADVTLASTQTTLSKTAQSLQENANNANMPIDSSLNKDAWTYFCENIPNLLRGEISSEAFVTEITNKNVWN